MKKSSLTIPLNFNVLGNFGERYSGEDFEYGAPICWDGKNQAILGKTKRGNEDKQSISLLEEDYLECFDKEMIPIGMIHTHPKMKIITNYADLPATVEDVEKSGKTNISLGDFFVVGLNMNKDNDMNPLLQQLNISCLSTPKNTVCVSPKPNSQDYINKAFELFNENDKKINDKWNDFSRRTNRILQDGANTLPKPFNTWTKTQILANVKQFNEESIKWLNAYQMTLIKDEHILSEQLYTNYFYGVQAQNNGINDLTVDPPRFENILKGFENRFTFSEEAMNAYNLNIPLPPLLLTSMKKHMNKKKADSMGNNIDQRLQVIQNIRKNAL